MLMKERTREGCLSARRRPVRPPIECPIRWKVSISKWERTASAVATRKGMSLVEREEDVVAPQPGAS